MLLPDDGKMFYSPSEIVALGVMSRTTIWRQINSGRLDAVQVGRSVRVSKESLQAFIDSHRYCANRALKVEA